MTHHSFYVIISLMSEVRADDVVAAFVRRGRRVEVASASKELCTGAGDNACALLAIEVSGDFSEEDPGKARSTFGGEVKTLLKSIDVKYYSYVVFQGRIATWSVGNVILPKKVEVPDEGPYRTPGNTVLLSAPFPEKKEAS